MAHHRHSTSTKEEIVLSFSFFSMVSAFARATASARSFRVATAGARPKWGPANTIGLRSQAQEGTSRPIPHKVGSPHGPRSSFGIVMEPCTKATMTIRYPIKIPCYTSEDPTTPAPISNGCSWTTNSQTPRKLCWPETQSAGWQASTGATTWEDYWTTLTLSTLFQTPASSLMPLFLANLPTKSTCWAICCTKLPT